MKLIRNTTPDGACKYALFRLDKMRADDISLDALLNQLGPFAEYFELADIGSSEEAFVIKLKDENSTPALVAYALSAHDTGHTELAEDVMGLLPRSGTRSPFCKKPD